MSEQQQSEQLRERVRSILGLAVERGQDGTLTNQAIQFGRIDACKAVLALLDAPVDNETTIDDGTVRVPLTALHELLAYAELSIDYDNRPSPEVRQAMIVLQALAGAALSASSAS